MADLEYLSLNKPMRFLYKIKMFFVNFFRNIGHFFKSIPGRCKRGFKKIGNPFINLVDAFNFGDWKTKVSFIIFGFGNLANGQILRGLLYLIYEVVFIIFMITFGGPYLSKFSTLGTVATTENPDTGFKYVGDNSFNILLYSVLTIIVIFCTIYVWYSSVKQAYVAKQMKDINKKLA